MPRREKLNEEHLRKRVKETRGIVRKVTFPGHRGAPDDFVGWPHLGTYSLVELKEEDQPWGLQDHQAREIQRLRSCGVPVAVLNSCDEIDAWIRMKTGQ